MAAQRERVPLKDGGECDVFSIRWDFVNTYLTHIEVEDPALVIHDLVDLERGLNQ